MTGLAYTPVAPPAWAGETGCVRHLYLFPTAATNPAPDASSNAFGTATAAVRLGLYSAGWQDPNEPLDSSGEPGNGAWDLGQGPAGAIRVTLPIGNVAAADPWFGTYRVELKVNAVACVPLVDLPLFSVDGYALTNQTQTDSLAFQDPPINSWYNRTWTARLDGLTGDTITLVVSAHPTSGSLIDAIEIYALAEIVPAARTALGTPLAWFDSWSLTPKDGEGWDEADLYDDDNDGVPNWKEFVAGTDPTDGQSFLHIVHVGIGADGRVSLEWIGGTRGPVAPYILESTGSLKVPDWQPIGQRARVDGTNDWKSDPMPAGGRRFFRVLAPRDTP